MSDADNNHNNGNRSNTGNQERPANRPGVLRIMQSILAGAFGVQSDRRRREDFSHHSPLPFIVAGLLFTAGFIAVLVVVVKLVLANH